MKRRIAWNRGRGIHAHTDPERRRWIQERLEGPQPAVDQERVLDQLIRADLFEQVLQQRYLGSKRFSLKA